MLSHAFRVLDIAETRMTVQCRSTYIYLLIITFFVSWMYFKLGDRGRVGCNELNDLIKFEGGQWAASNNAFFLMGSFICLVCCADNEAY